MDDMGREMSLSRRQAIEIVKCRYGAVEDGTEEVRAEGHPPVWMITATCESFSEAPWLANLVIHSRRRFAVDATGRVLSEQMIDGPHYIPIAPIREFPPRPISQVWRYRVAQAGSEHHVVMYSVRIMAPALSSFAAHIQPHYETAYEVLVDGEWASPDGYRCYRSRFDALVAAAEAIRSSN